MATVNRAAIALLILQIYVNAAPSDAPKSDEALNIKLDEPKLDSPLSVSENNESDATSIQSQRQKRFYNHYSFPPVPLPYPSYNKRDQASDLGVYGVAEDPLSTIHRRLQDIASVVRQNVPPPPPPVPHFPVYFPWFFVPHFGPTCSCNPQSTPPVTTRPQPIDPTTSSPTDGTTPDVNKRIPQLDDERQNWGVVPDQSEDDFTDDFNRPISFDPVQLNPSGSRPAPPVEHGSNQAGSQNGQSTTTTTARPRPPSASPPLSGSAAPAPPYPPTSAEPPRESPSTCDGAVLSCCHMPQVTYDCFAVLGCPDPTSYGNPCDPLVILRVIGKFQKFYGVRNG